MLFMLIRGQLFHKAFLETGYHVLPPRECEWKQLIKMSFVAYVMLFQELFEREQYFMTKETYTYQDYNNVVALLFQICKV